MKEWYQELWRDDVWSRGTAQKPVSLEDLEEHRPDLLAEFFGQTTPPSFKEPDAFREYCNQSRDALLAAFAPGEQRPARAIFKVLQGLRFTVVIEDDCLPKGTRGGIKWSAAKILINRTAYNAPSKNDLEHFQEAGAHELGHLVLHRAELAAGTPETPEMDREADEYSRDFLLPRAWLLKDPLLRGGRPGPAQFCRLAESWGVSKGLMVERLREIGIKTTFDRPKSSLRRGHRADG